MIGEFALLTGESRRNTAVASSNVVAVLVNRAALQQLFFAKKLTALGVTLDQSLEGTQLGGSDSDSEVQLKLHQGVACGEIWHVHTGGGSLAPQLGPRREYLILGQAVEMAAESLVQAHAGRVACGPRVWKVVEEIYEGVLLDKDCFRLQNLREGAAETACPGPVTAHTEKKPWTYLKRFSHEGARVLQDVVDFAADVRKISVVFMSLNIDVTMPTQVTRPSLLLYIYEIYYFISVIYCLISS